MAADATTPLGSAAPPHAAWTDAGLSIVVPLFNEANNLAALHQRILDVAHALKAGRGLATEVVYVDDGQAATARSPPPRSSFPADGLDIQVISLSRQLRQRGRAFSPVSTMPRLGAVLFMDGDGQHPPAPGAKARRLLARRRVRRGLQPPRPHRGSEPWLRRLGVKGVSTR